MPKSMAAYRKALRYWPANSVTKILNPKSINMKTLFYLGVAAVLFVTACTNDKTREFIPGIYVNSAGGEFSVADDTLIIEPAESNNYSIQRKTGFNVITEGKKESGSMKPSSGMPSTMRVPKPLPKPARASSSLSILKQAR